MYGSIDIHINAYRVPGTHIHMYIYMSTRTTRPALGSKQARVSHVLVYGPRDNGEQYARAGQVGRSSRAASSFLTVQISPAIVANP